MRSVWEPGDVRQWLLTSRRGIREQAERCRAKCEEAGGLSPRPQSDQLSLFQMPARLADGFGLKELA